MKISLNEFLKASKKVFNYDWLSIESIEKFVNFGGDSFEIFAEEDNIKTMIVKDTIKKGGVVEDNDAANFIHEVKKVMAIM